MTIHQMAESLHQLEEQVQMQHDREIYRGQEFQTTERDGPGVSGGALPAALHKTRR